jgi:protein-tyrosine phosphatase
VAFVESGIMIHMPPASTGTGKYRVCFVCTGNICRSPMAESVFRAYVARAGLDRSIVVDSAGTSGWHVGDPADDRAVSVLRAAGYQCEHVARRMDASWFDDHDLVVALASDHVSYLRKLAPDGDARDKVLMLGDFAVDVSRWDLSRDVPDPYYGTRRDFEHCLNLIEDGCASLLEAVRAGRPEPSP